MGVHIKKYGELHRGTANSYSPPKFADVNVRRALRKLQESAKATEEAANEADRLAQKTEDWSRLIDELIDLGVETVADLPEERQSYWKFKLDESLVVTFF